MKITFLIFNFLAVIISGCSYFLPQLKQTDFKSTYQIAGFKDPKYQGKIFKNVVIFADTNHLPTLYILESGVAKILLQNGINAIPAYTYFTPTREWTPADRKRFFRENNIEAYVVISAKGSVTWEYSVPERTTTTRTVTTQRTITGKDTIRHKRTSNEVENEQIRTEKTGGYTSKNTAVKYEAKLFTVENDDIAWMTQHSASPVNFSELLANRLIYDNLFFILKRKNE